MRLKAEAIDVRLGSRPVLEAVTADFAPGRITAIVGPNGAGKSTLLKAMAGLVAIERGRVLLDDRPLGDLDGRARARAIAYLPQERTVHWPLGARAVVALGRLPHRAAPSGESARDSEAIEAAMMAMDVGQLAARPVNELSGGERARVLFARALAQESGSILADEPTAGLDPAHALQLFAVLGRLAADGRAVAVALHDLSLAARFCHDVVILSGGRVAAAGPTAATMSAERLGAVFGVTMATGLFDGVPIVVPLG